MTALGDPKRLAALLGQLDADEETVRVVALSRIREHLTRHGQTFRDLAALVTAPAAATPPPPRPTQPAKPSRPLTEAEKAAAADLAFRERKRRLVASASAGPHLHDPVPRSGFLGSKTADGKRIVSSQPAAGSVGRIRIHREKDDYGLMTLDCSLETRFEVFEFKEKCMRGDGQHDQLVTLSRTGEPLRY